MGKIGLVKCVAGEHVLGNGNKVVNGRIHTIWTGQARLKTTTAETKFGRDVLH